MVYLLGFIWEFIGEKGAFTVDLFRKTAGLVAHNGRISIYFKWNRPLGL